MRTTALASLTLIALGTSCRPRAPSMPAPAQGQDCTYDRCALRLGHGPGATGVGQGAGGTSIAMFSFVPRVDLLAESSGEIRRHYLASRKHYRRYAFLGIPMLAAYLGTIGYYWGERVEANAWNPAPGVILPVAALALSWAGGASAAQGEDHLRRAIWLYNRQLWSDGGARASDCPYDRCALRLQKRTSSTWIVRGTEAAPVTRLGVPAPPVDLFATAGDSARAHYEAFRTLHDGNARVRRVLLLPLLGAAFLSASHSRDSRTIGYILLGIGYAIGHGTVYSDAAARSHLDDAVWFYNRSLYTRP